MTAVFYISSVILFWLALGAFTVWFSARILRVPTEAELEHAAAAAESGHKAAAH